MFVIAGLGNPGLKYAKTRHNAGFEVMDLLAGRHGIPIKTKKHRALVGKGVVGDRQVLLVKPQTYMNLSGESVGEIMEYYHLRPQEELLVISDDISLPAGTIRIRKKGSAGGHNGLKNIIEHCHTSDFVRIKIGVGDVADHGKLVSHVLGRHAFGERKKVQKAYEWAADAAAMIVRGEIERAMNDYNGRTAE